ncbi:MAG: GTP-binding protein [Candidatus Helarchaeota archaeon]|nr:GTP-binding protein [Candidatus Helarchaeota archaeon]
MGLENQGEQGLRFRILLAGEEGVGKTSIILRFIKNVFDDSSDPKAIEGDIITYSLNLFGAPVQLEIQDLKEANWAQVASYYTQDNDGILLVFDTTSKTVKPYLDYWLKTIRDLNAEIPVIVLGNKSDLPVKSNLQKVSQYISSIGFHFIQTSAKTGENVSYAFKLITSEIVKHKAASKKRTEGRRTDGLDVIFDRYKL